MSSTGRSDVRRPSDFYETPSWCVKVVAPYIKSSLARLVDDTSGDWGSLKQMQKGGAFLTVLDPGAGSGAITMALREHLGHKVSVSNGMEYIQIPVVLEAEELEEHLYLVMKRNVGKMPDVRPLNGDFLARRQHVDCVVCNPPYSMAMEFIQKAIEISNGDVWMLLRLDFLGSIKRGKWYRAGNMPDVYVLSKRPSFTGDGNTDSNNYAWFHWHCKQNEGNLKVLKC